MMLQSYHPLAFICTLLTIAQNVQSLSSGTNKSNSVSLGTLSVAPVALGSLNLPEDNAVDILKHAPAGTLIDTAELYGKGKAEETIASAAATAGLDLGKSIFCATKFAPKALRFNADSVVSACQESARRLGVACIDLYQIHYMDALQPLVQLGISKEKDELYWDGLAECYHQGLAANVGVCNYGPTMIRRAHEALSKRDVPLVSNQISFNLMRYGVTKETKAICDELGIKVLAYSPLGKGVMSCKYDVNYRDKMLESKFKYYRIMDCLKRTVPLRDALERIATKRQKTCAQVAINWAICKGAIPIAGARNVEQVADNSGAIGWSLSEEEVEELDATACEAVSPSKEFDLI